MKSWAQRRAHSLSLTAAREYRDLMARGDVVLAEQTRRSIDDLGCGRYVGGKWVLDRDIRQEMGLAAPRNPPGAKDGHRSEP